MLLQGASGGWYGSEVKRRKSGCGPDYMFLGFARKRGVAWGHRLIRYKRNGRRRSHSEIILGGRMEQDGVNRPSAAAASSPHLTFHARSTRNPPDDNGYPMRTTLDLQAQTH